MHVPRVRILPSRPDPARMPLPQTPAATPRVPILMYHEVAPRAHPGFERFTVTPAELERQVAWLARAGFTAVGPDDLLAAREGRRALPRRPVAITFDDGFADSVRHAPPILSRHGFTAVFYVVAGLVGGTSRWLERELGFELPMAGWDSLRELEAAGFHLGSHTVTHPRLARVSREECRTELAESRRILEEGLGHPVRHLAYPFGSHDAEVQRIAAEAGYLTACTTLEGLSGGEDTPLGLLRVPVYGGESRLDFASRVLTARPFVPMLRGGVKHVLRRLTGRGHGRSAG